MEMQNGQHKDEDLEAPPKLVAALRELPRESVFVPPTIDEALMKAARKHLGRAERQRPRWIRLISWTTATAGLATAVLLVFPHATQFLGFGQAKRVAHRGLEAPTDSRIQPQAKRLALASEDLNRDGTVDILDAFMLAKKLQGASSSDPNLDVNGDGVVDRRDVETIAAHAVSLEKGGRS
jgi:anti-sigma factor RsiW